MKTAARFALCSLSAVLMISSALGQDWPQWRGPHRDGKTSFSAPATWPKDLVNKWSVTVGEGDSTPCLVGDQLIVFSRREGRETTACLDATTGKELWRDPGYDVIAPAGPPGRHPGPRSTPVVADNRIVTYGVRGTLSCLDASNGKVLWRKDDMPGVTPRFFTASSPLVDGGLCVAQVGGDEKGAVIAYDVQTGEQKWTWAAEGTAYSSPVVATIAGRKQIVALTSKRLVGLNPEDGHLLWEVPFPAQGRAYNAATPIVNGATVICSGSGRGTKAFALQAQGDKFAAKDVWSNTNAVQFDTPVLRDDLVLGLAQSGDFFAVDAAEGATLWTEPGVGARDFGSVVDGGTVVATLSPRGQLIFHKPSKQADQRLASYKVAESEIYAYPVLSKNRIYIKDAKAVTLWTVE